MKNILIEQKKGRFYMGEVTFEQGWKRSSVEYVQGYKKSQGVFLCPN